MARVITSLTTEQGVVREGIANVATATYSVPSDQNGYPSVHTIRVYNACTITLPPVVDGVELHIISKYDDISPSNAVVLLLDDSATETILGLTSWALTEPRESIIILGDTNATTNDWGAV